MILLDQVFQHFPGFRLFRFIGRGRRIDHGRIEYLAGRISYRQLAACPECGIPAENRFSADGRLHEILGEVFLEYFYSAVLSHFRELGAYFIFNGRCDQSMVAVFDRFLDHRRCIRIITENDAAVE